MKDITYPFRDQSDAEMISDRNLFDRLITWYESAKVERRERTESREVDLRCVSPQGQTSLYPDDLPLVFLSRNDAKLMPGFLTHYRSLGVTRFICVDDASTDGTREYLLGEPDVDLWASALRYAEARRGRLWREALFARYGGDRWYLNVDSDEFLIYDDCENRTLWSVIHTLEDLKISRLPAPTLDMYPVNLGTADVNQLKTRAPWEVADHFDSRGYSLATTTRAITVKGGARHREFESDLELIKYPLIFWDEDCRFGASIHQPLPYQRNFSSVLGALLHFKFFADYEKVIEDAVADGQYFDGSAAYAKMTEALAGTGALQLFSHSSVKFGGSKQLLRLGFITPVPKSTAGGER
ncbi:Glycosyl transferase family 2 [Sinorhizobium sp. NFACC03]|nr:Glycosyl transferase family 2 [Sinorhizobium sp. NFACC03]